MNEPQKQINVYLPQELWDAVMQFSLKESVRRGKRVTLSDTIRESLRAYIAAGQEASNA